MLAALPRRWRRRSASCPTSHVAIVGRAVPGLVRSASVGHRGRRRSETATEGAMEPSLGASRPSPAIDTDLRRRDPTGTRQQGSARDDAGQDNAASMHAPTVRRSIRAPTVRRSNRALEVARRQGRTRPGRDRCATAEFGARGPGLTGPAWLGEPKVSSPGRWCGRCRCPAGCPSWTSRSEPPPAARSRARCPGSAGRPPC
jgi:hypothetical protein